MNMDLGRLLGWLLIIALTGTLLNFCLKQINKYFGKKISASPLGKQIMKFLMKLFVRNHRYFGIAAVILLFVHFIVQFSTYGINVAGMIAAILLISQVSLGIYAILKKKPRHGVWFITHRVIAALLVLSIALHLIAPYALNVLLPQKDTVLSSESVSNSELPAFTLEELSKYDGENGSKAYVAYKGVVYDITNHPKWAEGKHNGNTAGTDLTNEISKSPHGESKFDTLEVVGTLQ